MNASRQDTASSLRGMKLLVFTGGTVTLAIELAASRLLGAYFGVSNVVWAAIISLILLYLAVGYFVGGLWADQKPRLITLFQIGAWAGFLSGLIPLAAEWLLPALARFQLPLLAGVLGAIALLYIVPTILLGCISPFAIRLAVLSLSDAGQVTGGIYTYATLGSIVGSLLPVLYLLPAVGTRLTFLLAGGLLLGVSLAGLSGEERATFLKYLWMPVVYLGLFIFS